MAIRRAWVSMEFRRNVWAREIDFGSDTKKMMFRTFSINEVTKWVMAIEEKGKRAKP